MKKSTPKTKRSATKSSVRRKSAHKGMGAESYEALCNGYEALLNSNIGRKIKRNVSSSDMTKGLVAMGLAGAATLMLLKARQPKPAHNQIYQAYNDLKDRANEYAHDAYDYAEDLADNVKESAQDILEYSESHPLLLGAIGGSLLGASALYLLNRNGSVPSEEMISKIKKAIGSLANSGKKSKGWSDTVMDVLEAVNGNSGKKASSTLHNAVELGMNGLSLLEAIMKKR